MDSLLSDLEDCLHDPKSVEEAALVIGLGAGCSAGKSHGCPSAEMPW